MKLLILRTGKIINHILSNLNFPEVIRTPVDEFEMILRAKKSIAKVALIDKRYVGFIFGYHPTKDEIKYHSLQDISTQGMVYVFDLVIDPEFQGKGYGYQLMSEFIRSAKEKGYTKLAGHFRLGSSLNLIKKFGAKEVLSFSNWEESGETYVLCVLDLS